MECLDAEKNDSVKDQTNKCVFCVPCVAGIDEGDSNLTCLLEQPPFAFILKANANGDLHELARLRTHRIACTSPLHYT